jgi:hypothetical protein
MWNANTALTIAPTPAASPSRPSKKLMVLIMPMIQTSVNATTKA